MSEPVRPQGVQIDVTSTQMVIVNFDHADVPPIALSIQGAEQAGSNIQSASSRAKHE